MKFKLGLSVIFSILFIQSAYSQTLKQDTFYRSFGIDIFFVNTLLPLDNTIGIPGKYLFHYLKYKENNKFTKHALDLSLSGFFEENTSEVDRDDIRINLEYKIGRGKRKNAFKNAYVVYGTELRLNYFLNKRTIIDPNDLSGESINTNLDQTWSASVGPVLGLGYMINKRISLYAEGGVYLNFAYRIDDFKSESNPSSDFNDTTISFLTSYVFPTSLVLFYHF